MEQWEGSGSGSSSADGTQLCFRNPRRLVGTPWTMSVPCATPLPSSTGGKLRQAGAAGCWGCAVTLRQREEWWLGSLLLNLCQSRDSPRKSTAQTQELQGHGPLGCFAYDGDGRKAMLMDGQTGGQADCCLPGCRAEPGLAVMALNSLC